jgi:hypothetical protein
VANLTIYRAGSPFTTVSTGDNDTVYTGEIMGVNRITSNFDTASKIQFKLDDYVMHNAHTFHLRVLPKHTKRGGYEHSWQAVFVGREYTLYKYLFRHLGNATFTYLGTAQEHLTLVIDWLNTFDPGWTIGDVDDTTELFIDYSKDNCRTAITKIAEAFKLEYEFKVQVLNMVKTIGGYDHALTFGQGMGNGLYEITRAMVDNSGFGTRFYGFGGSENLPANYKGGVTQLITTSGFVERKVSKYGVIEVPVDFPDIKPERTGTITAAPDINQVTDSTLDFDLNGQIVDGAARIVFTSGDLQGQSFDIAKYNHTTKTITFNINKDESGYELPNDTVGVSISDKYKLVGIIMPQTYVDDAEARLGVALNEYADANEDPHFAFDVEIDPIRMAEIGYAHAINQGDRVHAVEPDMDTDVVIRITTVEYPLFQPYAIKATISDTVKYDIGTQVIKDVVTQKEQVSQIKRTSLQLQQINSIRRQELHNSSFDPDGYLKPERIEAGSIEANRLATGARSQDFSLSTLFKPNFNADPNAIQWTGGDLVHFTIADITKTWNISSGSASALTPTTLYYIYAKCDKSGTAGTIVIDPTQRRFNDDPDDYYFLIGVLHTVVAGVRWISLTYGSSEINGRFLTTGRVSSADGLTWFDLDSGEISGNIVFRKSDGGLQNVADLADAVGTIEGSLGDLAYADVVGLAMLDTTVIVGGYLKTTLLDAPYIKSSIVQTTDLSASKIVTGTLNASIVTVTNLNASNITTGTLAAARIDANNLFVGNSTDGWIINKNEIRSKAETSPGNPRTQLTIDGSLYANNAVISGDIIAYSGSIGGIEINSGGIYSYNLNFSLDFAGNLVAKAGSIGGVNIYSSTISSTNGKFSLSSLGRLDATDAYITGHIEATSGSISGSLLVGTIDASILSVVNLNASSITTGTINASAVTITNINASNITTGSINAATVTITNLNASNITSGSINAATITITNLNASNITSGTINTARLDATTIKTSIVQTTDLSANKIVTGTLDASIVNVVNLSASNITSGTISTARLDVSDLQANYINASYMEGLSLDFVQGTIGGNTITSDGITGAKFSIIDGLITAEDAVITGTFKTSETGQRVVIDSLSNSLTFYSSSGVVASINNTADGSSPGFKIGDSSFIDGAIVLGSNSTIQKSTISLIDGGDGFSISPAGIVIASGSTYHSGHTGDVTVGARTLRIYGGIIYAVI